MARIYRRPGSRKWWGRVQRAGRELRRSLQTTDRSVAERRLRAWLDELDAVAWGEKPRRSFDATAEKFIQEHLTTLKPAAATRYGVSLKHLAEHFGGKTLDHITSSELSAFETKRRTAGVAPSTIRRDLACLSSLLTSAEDWEWIDDGANPVPAYLRRRARRGLKEAPPRTRYLTLQEEVRILQAASAEVRKAIILAIDTGLRREELFSLTWLQVDLVRGLITTTTRTKNGRARKVPVPARSAQILAQIKVKLAKNAQYVLINPDTGERYVQMNTGLAGAVRRANKAELNRLGPNERDALPIKDLRWHDLRRTAGCRWLQRDHKSMEEVSILLGHSSVTITEACYAFLEAETVAQSLSGAHKSAHNAADLA
jgi:integrase